MRVFLTLGGLNMHVKDFGMAFLDDYVLSVCYGKKIIMPLGWDFGEPCCFMYYVSLEREYAWQEYESGNKDENGMHDIKKKKNVTMMRFVINDVFICFPLCYKGRWIIVICALGDW